MVRGMSEAVVQPDDGEDRRPARRLPGRGQCKWPMWGHAEPVSHRHCCLPVQVVGAAGLTGRYCQKHAASARRPLLAIVAAPAVLVPARVPRPEPALEPEPVARDRRQRLDADRAVAMRERGATVPQIAQALSVSRSTVTRLFDRRGMPQGRGAVLAMGASRGE